MPFSALSSQTSNRYSPLFYFISCYLTLFYSIKSLCPIVVLGTLTPVCLAGMKERFGCLIIQSFHGLILSLSDSYPADYILTEAHAQTDTRARALWLNGSDSEVLCPTKTWHRETQRLREQSAPQHSGANRSPFLGLCLSLCNGKHYKSGPSGSRQNHPLGTVSRFSQLQLRCHRFFFQSSSSVWCLLFVFEFWFHVHYISISRHAASIPTSSCSFNYIKQQKNKMQYLTNSGRN